MHKYLYMSSLLNLVHGCNVDRLDEILELSHLLAELFDGNFVILNDAHQLQLVDAIANRDQLGGSPEETVHLDGGAGLLHGIHVSLIIPGLHVKEDVGLGDHFWLLGFLGWLAV